MTRSRILPVLFPLLLLAACGSDGPQKPAQPAASTATTDAPPVADQAGAPEPAASSVSAETSAAPAPVAETEPAPAADAGPDITISTFQFKPSPLTVAPGTTVDILNSDNTTHTMTAGTPDAPTGEFDVRLEGRDATGSFTIDKPGTYSFFCAIHTSMTGELVVG